MARVGCDVCGGNLQMDAGGKTATCQFCGMQYSVERMREKIQEIRGTVKVEGSVQARQTGTTEDVEQWRTLMHKYLEASDYQSAYDIIGKIMQAAPSDEECSKLYPLVRDYIDLKVADGKLFKYNGKRSELALPDGIREIGEDAFAGNNGIKKVVLPDSVQTIAAGAFEKASIKEIAISPNSKLLCIGAHAFMDSQLTSIYIPASLTTLSEQAFFGCPIEKVEFAPKGNLTCIGESAFAHTRITDIVIPDYIKEIRYQAFCGCPLEKVEFAPKGNLTCIGKSAFAHTRITDIVIPDGIKEIGDRAFHGCGLLKNVSFLNVNNIESIGEVAFGGCSSLYSFPESFPNLKKAGCSILGDPGWNLDEEGPLVKKQKERFGEIWKRNGQCPGCGGTVIKKGVFGIFTCINCNSSWKN